MGLAAPKIENIFRVVLGSSIEHGRKQVNYDSSSIGQ